MQTLPEPGDAKDDWAKERTMFAPLCRSGSALHHFKPNPWTPMSIFSQSY